MDEKRRIVGGPAKDFERLNGLHEFRSAEPEDFRGLDLAFYKRVTDRLGELGYSHLDDALDVTVEEVMGHRTPVRLHASSDGTTLAICFSLGRSSESVAALCEFSDGRHLIVKTGGGSVLSDFAVHPQIATHVLPRRTSLDGLLDVFEDRKQMMLRQRPGASVVVMRAAIDVLMSDKRRQLLVRYPPG